MDANTKAFAPTRISAWRTRQKGTNQQEIAKTEGVQKRALIHEITTTLGVIHDQWGRILNPDNTIVLAVEVPKSQWPARSWFARLFPDVYEPTPTTMAKSQTAYPLGTVQLPSKRWPLRLWIDLESAQAFYQLNVFTVRQVNRHTLIELSVEDLQAIRDFIAEYLSRANSVH